MSRCRSRQPIAQGAETDDDKTLPRASGGVCSDADGGSGTAMIAAGPQAPAQSPAKDDALQMIPVRIDVVLTRLQGEKRDQQPAVQPACQRCRQAYVLPACQHSDGHRRTHRHDNRDREPHRFGWGRSVAFVGKHEHETQVQSVGTDIDCSAERLDENRFSVWVSINDSSIYSPDAGGKALKDSGPLAFRTFSTRNTVVMRDGQTVLFGTGSDKISGETLKIEVGLHVVK